jgi:hypothetical protein
MKFLGEGCIILLSLIVTIFVSVAIIVVVILK